jgi:hypothetical protein
LLLAKAGLNDRTVAQLPKLPTLKRLVLDSNEIRGPGLAHLSGRPESIGLSLGHPNLTDLLAKNLAELKQVKRLALAGSGLTDAGITHLAGLTNLERLSTFAAPRPAPPASPNCKMPCRSARSSRTG